MAQDSVVQQATDRHLLCSWCGVYLSLVSSIGDSVCSRCYQLLVNAGVPEEEIFDISSDTEECQA